MRATALLFSSFIVFSQLAYSAPNLTPYFTKPTKPQEEATTPSGECVLGSQPKRFGVRHIEGKGIGYHQGYTTLEAFLGRKFNNSLPFIDLRGHVFNDGRWAANGGLGYRYQAENRIYGINAYYDYRKTSKQHYNQVGVGLETLGKHWDFRINGYWPVGDKSSHFYHTRFKRFECNNLIVSRKQEFAMKGVHAEAGAHIYNRHNEKFKNTELYVAFGPYYFEGKGQNAYGGQVRLLGKYKDRFTLQASASYDNVFHDIYQGEVAIYFPFGKKEKVKKPCETNLVLSDRISQPVYREEIIVLDKHRKNFVANDPCTCCPLEFIFVNNCFDGCGSFENPYGSLREALNHSDPGDIIYIFPGNGNQNGMTAGSVPFQLKDDQQLLGAGICQDICTNFGVINVPCLAQGLPILSSDNDFSVISIANNNTISGLNIRLWTVNVAPSFTPFAIGSQVGTTNNLFVRNNIIDANLGGLRQGGEARGIFLNNSAGDIVICGNRFNTTGNAIVASSTNTTSSYLINDNQFVGAGFNGFFFNQDGGFVTQTITNNIFNGFIFQMAAGVNILVNNPSGSPAIYEGFISNNDFDGDGAGVRLFVTGDTTVAASFDIFSNTFSNNSAGASFQTNGNAVGNFIIKNNTVMDSANTNGFNLSTEGFSTGNFIVSDNSFSNNISALSSIAQVNSTLNAIIENNSFRNSTNIAIDASSINDATGNYLIINNTIDNSGIGINTSDSVTSHLNAHIENNKISYSNGNGMLLGSFGSPNYIVINNEVDDTYLIPGKPTIQGIFIGNTGELCLRFQNNISCTNDPFILNNQNTTHAEPLIGNCPQLTVEGLPVIDVPQGTCGP